jgi:ketosteroid isomerase-like protein
LSKADFNNCKNKCKVKKIIIFLTFSLFSISVYSQSSSNEVLQLLLDADNNWATACKSKDVNRMIAFYDEEATLVVQPPVRGADDLRKLWEKYFSLPDYLLTWQAEDAWISKSGDIAYTSGPWEQQWTQDGKLLKFTGRYLAVWRKQKDGSWKVLIDQP